MWGSPGQPYGNVLLTLFVLLAFALTTWILLVWLGRLPVDYFLVRRIKAVKPGVLSLTWSVIRTLFGVTFVLVGLVFLFVPGPGIPMIILGVVISDFRGKQLLLRKLVRNPGVLASLNWLRSKSGRPPFLRP